MMSSNSQENSEKFLENLWAEFIAQNSLDHFPKKILWLNGAPGAGKGTQSKWICEVFCKKAPPIIMSQLFRQIPETQKCINTGRLVEDAIAIRLLLQQLAKVKDPILLVDGFPRTPFQAQFLSFLQLKIKETLTQKIPFYVIILMIDEETSIVRQTLRGQIAQSKTVQDDVHQEIRVTDCDHNCMLVRYKSFKKQTYEALTYLKEHFDCIWVEANKTKELVREQIEKALIEKGL